MDSLSWGRPFNAPPKVEICGGGPIDHNLGGRIHSCELSFFYALCGGREGVFGNVLSSIGGGEQCLCGISPSTTTPIWGHVNGSQGNVGTWIRAWNRFWAEWQWCGKLGRFTGNRGRFKLGNEPMHTDVRRSALERRGRSIGRPQVLQVKGVPLCHITSTKALSARVRCAKGGSP